MTFSNQTVNLKLISRPLRMAYLVEGMSDLETAVKLYTHVWGGQAGVILPIPSDEEDMHKLASTLMEVDPDNSIWRRYYSPEERSRFGCYSW